MKKAILYLFFWGLVLSNTSTAHALVSSDNKLTNASYQKIKEASFVAFEVSQSISFIYKTDFINDFDDYDEIDFDEHIKVIKHKLLFANTPYFKSNQVTQYYCNKTFCNKIYCHVNFSRLPRFNYISLGVLRL